MSRWLCSLLYVAWHRHRRFAPSRTGPSPKAAVAYVCGEGANVESLARQAYELSVVDNTRVRVTAGLRATYSRGYGVSCMQYRTHHITAPYHIVCALTFTIKTRNKTPLQQINYHHFIIIIEMNTTVETIDTWSSTTGGDGIFGYFVIGYPYE